MDKLSDGKQDIENRDQSLLRASARDSKCVLTPGSSPSPGPFPSLGHWGSLCSGQVAGLSREAVFRIVGHPPITPFRLTLCQDKECLEVAPML